MGSSSSQALLMVSAAGGGAALSLTLDSYSATQTGVGTGPFTTNNVNAIPAGGTPAYTYSWVRQSGNATISVSSSTAQGPSWSASGTPTQTKSAVWRCTVTDSLSATAIPPSDVTVSIIFNNSALSASLDYSSISAQGYAGGSYKLATSPVTCTPSGGTGPYTYLWIRNSGDTIAAESGTSQSSIFSYASAPVDTRIATYYCRVTDSLSNTANSGLVTIELDFL